jgi:hypothetical protein
MVAPIAIEYTGHKNKNAANFARLLRRRIIDLQGWILEPPHGTPHNQAQITLGWLAYKMSY